MDSSSQPLSESKRRLIERRLRGTASPRSRVEVHRPPDAVSGPQPASSAQQWMFRVHQSEATEAAFNLTSGFRVTGHLDLGRLERSIGQVVSRHESLRSSFLTTAEGLRVIVQEQAQVAIAVVTCAGPDDLRSQAETIARRPFDPSCAPLFRWAYLTSPGADPLLLVTISDLLSDRWSLGILWSEIRAVYEAESQGRPPSLPAMDAQYAAVRGWQRELEASGEIRRQVEFWANRLAKLPPPLPLPTDRPYPARLSYEGRLERGVIDPALTGALRQLAASENATLFALLLAGFQALLHRYTSTDDIVVGTPIANRRRRETAGLIGLFLTTVAMRVRLDDRVTGRELLGHARKAVLEAIDNQDAPFDRVVEAADPPRVRGRHPVFQAMFVHQTEAEAPRQLSVGEAVLQQDLIDTGTSRFDLSLFAVETGDGMETILEYRTDLFEPQSAQRILGHYEQLLRSLVSDPDVPVSELRLLTDAELGRLLRFSQGESFASGSVPNLTAQIRTRASAQPDVPAVVGSSGALTYGQMLEQADAISARLLAVSTRGRAVGHFVDRQPGAIAALLGILEAGAAYVPIDPAYPADRREFIARDAGLSTAVTTGLLQGRIQGIVEHKVLLDQSGDSGRIDPSRPPIGRDDPAYFIYTSGSSGDPKGVVVTHQNLVSSNEARVRYYGEAPARFLLIPSLSFDSSVAVIFWTLAAGGTLVIADEEAQRNPQTLCALIAANGVSDLLCIPTLYREILLCGGAELQSLRRAIVAGETCPPDVVALHYARVPEARLFNEYGPTEATVWATVHACSADEAAPGSSVPIGRPIPNAAAIVIDRHGQLAPVGLPGELYLGGPGIALGYHQRAELTGARFVERDLPGFGVRRLYRTGDLARWRPDGLLEFLGRVDDQLKVRGHRIEPREIEAALERHPSVRRAVVVAAARQAGGQPVVADDVPSIVGALPDPTLEELVRSIEALSPEAIRETLSGSRPGLAHGDYVRAGEGFRLELHMQPGFINPPRAAQRRWLLARALEDFAEDLQQLDVAARSFVPGTEPTLASGIGDATQARLTEQQIMEDWQVPLMQAMARHVAEAHGDVLEIGFGRGVSAEFIQQIGVRSHTVLEPNEYSIKDHFQPWRARHRERDIRLVQARWQDVEHGLGLFDGIFFHAFPLNEEEFAEYMLRSVTFAEHAFAPMASHLRPGGVFTYLSTEIDSLSRRHQRRLLQHFREVSISVESLQVPADTRDMWWAPSMVIVRAVR